jgi:hypothetical protein
MWFPIGFCPERKQPSRVGGSPLCDVVSSFLCHTHTDRKDKFLEWLLLKTAEKIFVSRNVISHRLSGVSLLAVSNVNNPVGLLGLPYVMWPAHFFVTHIQTEKISSWNGPTVHVCCFMLARASTKTFISRVRKTVKKIFVSRKIH